MSVRAVVLAAGRGTRMRSDRPKVLFEVAGRPLVVWVVDAVIAAGVDDVTVVVGHGGEAVAEILPEGVRIAVQEPQLGTGHAVMAALDHMGDVAGDTVLVVPGDTPLLRPETLGALLEAHSGSGCAATLLTVTSDDRRCRRCRDHHRRGPGER